MEALPGRRVAQPLGVAVGMDIRPSAFFILLMLQLLFRLAVAFGHRELVDLPHRGPSIPNPDGDLAVFDQHRRFASGLSNSSLFLIPLKCESSDSPTVLTEAPVLGDPCWLDGKTILYRSEANGLAYLRAYDLRSRTDHCLYTFPGIIRGLKANSVGNRVRVAFSTQVDRMGFPIKPNETDGSEPLVYEQLYVRLGDEWVTKKNAIFSGTLTRTESGYRFIDPPHNIMNLTEELRLLESPTPLGGTRDYAVSDKFIAFIAHDPLLNPATTTTSHVYIFKYDEAKIDVSRVNHGGGGSLGPAWSPDGVSLAYLEQREAGHGTDRTSPLQQH